MERVRNWRLVLRGAVSPQTFFFFFFTLVTGPRRSLSLKLSGTRVHAPEIRGDRLLRRLVLRGAVSPHTLHPHPSTLNPQPYTLNPTPSTLHPQPYTLNPTPSTLNPLNPEH